jgi:hypothetical protein
MKEYAGSFIASAPILVRLQPNAWRTILVAACAVAPPTQHAGRCFGQKVASDCVALRSGTTRLLPFFAIDKIFG